MKRLSKAIGMIVVASLSAGQASAQAADCLTGAEVTSLALTLLPEGLQAVADTCGTALPPGALLARADAPLFERYRTEAAPHMALAQAAFGKLTGLGKSDAVSAPGLDLMKAMIVPELSKTIDVKDCGAINHMIELFEPMPPENMAGAIATILQIMARDEAGKPAKKTKKKSAKNDFNVCPYQDDF